MQTMRTVICSTPGKLTDLTITDAASPPCPDDRIRVAVKACGLNFVDALFVQGGYQIKPPPPFTPGSELAGEIVEVGSGVNDFALGDRVFASVGLGGFTSEVVLSPRQLTRIPDNISYAQAATLGQSYATAWYTLTRRTNVGPGDWVVSLGAAGGVGSAVLDVARHMGAQTVAAASSDERLAACAAWAPTATVNYSTTDLKAAIRECTNGGANVVVDPVGGDLSDAALRSLTDNGRLMIVGFATGQIPQLPANQILLRNRSVIGVDWGIWAMTHGDENAAMMAEILTVIGSGGLTPVEPIEYSLDDVVRALEDLVEHRTIGKAALIP